MDLQVLGVAVEKYSERFLRPLMAGLHAAPGRKKPPKCKRPLKGGVRVARNPAKLRKRTKPQNTRQEAAPTRAMPFRYKRPPILVPARKHTLQPKMPMKKVRRRVARSHQMPFRFKRPPIVVPARKRTRPPVVVRRAHAEGPHKHIFVLSGCGTGKTERCRELLQQVKPSSILILAPRQLFARSMMRFQDVLPGLRVYSDSSHADRKAHRYLICQMESLWSVAEHYDCIIIDESESCLYQLSSSTVKKFEAVTEAFERVVRSSEPMQSGQTPSSQTARWWWLAGWTPAPAPSWCTTRTCQTSDRHTASGGTRRPSQSCWLQQLPWQRMASGMWWCPRARSWRMRLVQHWAGHTSEAKQLQLALKAHVSC